MALTGVAASGALLAACAPAAAPATGGESGAASAPTTIRSAWHGSQTAAPSTAMTQEVAIPEFQERNPGITVEMQFVPESELQQKLLTAKAAGNLPDISSIDETFLDTLTKQEVLRPIPEETIDVGTEMGDSPSFLYRLPQGADDGRYYGLPNGVFSAALYYNNTLLEEMGYTPEDIPTTWDDFLLWASEVSVWDGDTLTTSGCTFFANEFSIWEDLRYQYAGAIDGNPFPDKESIRLADDVGIQSWQFIMDMYNVHKIDSIAEGLISRDRFGAGNAVTLYNWTWFNGFMDTQYPDENWGIARPTLNQWRTDLWSSWARCRLHTDHPKREQPRCRVDLLSLSSWPGLSCPLLQIARHPAEPARACGIRLNSVPSLGRIGPPLPRRTSPKIRSTRASGLQNWSL